MGLLKGLLRSGACVSQSWAMRHRRAGTWALAAELETPLVSSMYGPGDIGTLALTLLLTVASVAGPPDSWVGARTAHFTTLTERESVERLLAAAVRRP